MTISVPCLLNWSQRSLPSSSAFDSSHVFEDDDDDNARCCSLIDADLPADDVMDDEDENDEEDDDEELDSLPLGGVKVKLLGDNDLFSVF